MFEDDRSYFQRRAQAEVERARAATSPAVIRLHDQLAAAYLKKLAAAEPVEANASRSAR